MDEEGGEEGAVKEEGEEEDSCALYGSHGPKFGGGCKFLYNQFELHSPVAKTNQIILLKVPRNIFIIRTFSWWCSGIGLHAPDCRDIQQGV